MNSCNVYLQVESPDKKRKQFSKKGNNSLNDYLQVERRENNKI